MIKRSVLISLVLAVVASAVWGNGTDPFSYHTSLQGILGLPWEDYGMESGTGSDEHRQDAVLGFQIGSRWYIRRGEQFAWGILVNWVDVVQASTPLNATESFTILDIGLLEIGVVASLRLGDTAAVDLCYQVRPTLLINKIITTVGFVFPTADGFGLAQEIHRTGLGVGHSVGVSFRYERYNVGAEFLFGGLPNFFNEDLMGEEGSIAIHPVMSLKPDLRTECLRIVIGIQR